MNDFSADLWPHQTPTNFNSCHFHPFSRVWVLGLEIKTTTAMISDQVRLGVLKSTPHQHHTIHRHLSHILCTQAVNQFWTSYSLGRIMIATPIKIISWLGYWRCNKTLAIEFFKSSVWIHVRGRHVDDHFNKYILDSVLGSFCTCDQQDTVILHLLPAACSPPCFP